MFMKNKRTGQNKNKKMNITVNQGKQAYLTNYTVHVQSYKCYFPV